MPTPLHVGSNNLPKPNITLVEQVAEKIAPVLKAGDLVILESTCPVGTTEKIVKIMARLRPDLKFCDENSNTHDVSVAYCPERVLPGKILHELINNDRVIGGISTACAKKAKKLYEIFLKGQCFISNARTAEMVKLTENASRDVQIAFANELSIICGDLDINVWNLIELANKHPRVNILQPGPGVGGHCIAVDPWFLIDAAPQKAKLMETARRINDGKPEWVLKQILKAIEKFNKTSSSLPLKKVKIAFYGLAFKANIDDLRESPSIEIVKHFATSNDLEIFAVEPNIEKLPLSISHCSLVNFETAKKLADIHVLLVNHEGFETPPISEYIVDTKGCWSLINEPIKIK